MNIPSHWRRALPLASLTTWRIGGPARFFSAPADLEAMQADLAAAQALKVPVFALGAGSNLLFSDAGYDGLILRPPAALPGATSDPQDPSTPLARLSAGAPLSAEGRRLARGGWGGLHWAEGIPGTVGGGIVNNAGAHGGDIAQTVESIEVLLPDGTRQEWTAADLKLAYRHSVLKHHDPTVAFIATALFRMVPTPAPELARAMQETRAQREARIPSEPSCGCVFRNPPEIPAGRLLQQLGVSGMRFGGLQVSRQHANFIVNTGQATAADALEAIGHLRARALADRGIQLELEVQLVGFPPGLINY
jgi:UDP-N-acetylmuramate dehydrogenase